MSATTAARTIELLRCVLPPLTPFSRNLILSIVNQSGRFDSEDQLARQAGLHNRHALARTLKREGLPSICRLAAWIRVLTWVLECEEDGVSISALALGRCHEPAAYYRTIKRVTHHTWRELQSLGVPWILLELERECRGRVIPSHPERVGEAHASPLWVDGRSISDVSKSA
jgi:DNA-binding phage protein